MLNDFLELQKLIKRKNTIEDKINKISSKFSKEIFNKEWQYDGSECYVSFVNYETNTIHLSDKSYRGTRLDGFTKKKFTFEEFIEFYGLQ